jgi:fluoroquinolone transport system ATP-binding protein
LRFGEPTVRVEHVTDAGLAVDDFSLAGIGDNRAFIDLLRTGNVRTIHTREATLEDVFLRVTGTSLA